MSSSGVASYSSSTFTFQPRDLQPTNDGCLNANAFIRPLQEVRACEKVTPKELNASSADKRKKITIGSIAKNLDISLILKLLCNEVEIFITERNALRLTKELDATVGKIKSLEGIQFTSVTAGTFTLKTKFNLSKADAFPFYMRFKGIFDCFVQSKSVSLETFYRIVDDADLKELEKLQNSTNEEIACIAKLIIAIKANLKADQRVFECNPTRYSALTKVLSSYADIKWIRLCRDVSPYLYELMMSLASTSSRESVFNFYNPSYITTLEQLLETDKFIRFYRDQKDVYRYFHDKYAKEPKPAYTFIAPDKLYSEKFLPSRASSQTYEEEVTSGESTKSKTKGGTKVKPIAVKALAAPNLQESSAKEEESVPEVASSSKQLPPQNQRVQEIISSLSHKVSYDSRVTRWFKLTVGSEIQQTFEAIKKFEDGSENKYANMTDPQLLAQLTFHGFSKVVDRVLFGNPGLKKRYTYERDSSLSDRKCYSCFAQVIYKDQTSLEGTIGYGFGSKGKCFHRMFFPYTSSDIQEKSFQGLLENTFSQVSDVKDDSSEDPFYDTSDEKVIFDDDLVSVDTATNVITVKDHKLELEIKILPTVRD